MNTQSEACLAESEESSSDLKNKDLEQNGLLKMINTQKLSSKEISKKPLFMGILHNLIFQSYQKWMSSLEDSHAKILVQRTQSEKESMERNLDYGCFTLKRLGYYDQESHSLKTTQTLLLKDSTLSLQTLPLSGMMRNGILYPLGLLEIPKPEKGYSLLP